ncbi:MAG: ester cyclase [Candidatus Kapaibacterium sp.]
MEHQYEELTRELHENFSANNFDRCVEVADEAVEVKAHAFGLTFRGREEFRNFMMGFKGAFPDMRIDYRNVVNSNNKIAVQFFAHGTHTGELQTPGGVIPPTGREVTLEVAEFLEWEDGKLKRIENYQDAGSLMRQLGLM